MKFVWIIALLAVATIVVAWRQTPQYVGAAVDRDQNVLTGGPITGVTLQDLPPAVKQALKHHVPHAEIALIDKTSRNGEVTYQFTFTEASETPELDVREDGQVLAATTQERR